MCPETLHRGRQMLHQRACTGILLLTAPRPDPSCRALRPDFPERHTNHLTPIKNFNAHEIASLLYGIKTLTKQWLAQQIHLHADVSDNSMGGNR